MSRKSQTSYPNRIARQQKKASTMTPMRTSMRTMMMPNCLKMMRKQTTKNLKSSNKLSLSKLMVKNLKLISRS